MSETLTAAALDRPISAGGSLVTAPRRDRGVAWGAILAGAAAAAAVSLLLLLLGVGLGLSAVSPWKFEGVSAETFGVSTILWVTFTQLVAAAIGGYLAGRLRAPSLEEPTDEIYFRDTAHGFLAWSVASLTTAALLTTAIGAIVGVGTHAGATMAGGAAAAAGNTVQMASANGASGGSDTMGYFVDSLFRQDSSGAATSGLNNYDMNGSGTDLPGATTEAAGIFANAIREGTMPAEDVQYVGQVVAQRTGLSQQDAEQRVADTYTRMESWLEETEVKAKEAADEARESSAYAAIWFFIALLIGAFVASLTATFGGRKRDEDLVLDDGHRHNSDYPASRPAR